MRTTAEIIADVKDGKGVDYEELKLACIVQSSLLFLFQQDVKHLLAGGLQAEMVKQSNYSDKQTSSIQSGIPSFYWKAMKSEPTKWLSPRSIPGTDEWKQFHKITTGLMNKILNEGD